MKRGLTNVCVIVNEHCVGTDQSILTEAVPKIKNDRHTNLRVDIIWLRRQT